MTLPTVIVAIDNALDALDACLAALERTLPAGHAVLLADDASGDPRIARLIADWRGRSRLAVRCLRGELPRGFAAQCNRALKQTDGADVVVLAATAWVTPGWLQQLARCAASDERIASITPWSNAAEFCSYPRFIENNPLPTRVELDALAEAAASVTAPDSPELPTAAGGCVFLRRSTLRQIGDFDSASFAAGAGELSDWCLRARAMGWRHVLCDTAFVGQQLRQTGADGPADGGSLDRLYARWPDYYETVARFLMADPLHPLRERLHQALARLAQAGPQRDLFGALA